MARWQNTACGTIQTGTTDDGRRVKVQRLFGTVVGIRDNRNRKVDPATPVRLIGHKASRLRGGL